MPSDRNAVPRFQRDRFVHFDDGVSLASDCEQLNGMFPVFCGDRRVRFDLPGVAEKQIFAEVLKHTEGNLTQAAKFLGITSTTLRARLESLGMSLEKSATVT